MKRVLPTVLLVVGCSTSEGQPHGPSFTFDAMTHPPGADAADRDGNEPLPDTGATTPDSATPVDAGGCRANLAIVAGDKTALHGAFSGGGGPWKVDAIANATALSAPAIVAQGLGFHAVMRGADGSLKATAYASAWGTATPIAAIARDKPALASVGGILHLVYSGNDAKLYHGTLGASGWDAANDPVGGAGALQDFGPSAASAAGSATTLIVLFDGNDHVLYDRSFAGTWEPAHPQAGTSVYISAAQPTPAPTLIALTGGPDDLLAIYLAQGAQPFIYYAVRNAVTKVWSAALPIDSDAASNDAPTLAALDAGRAVLMWRGTNGMAYFNTYDPANAPPWRQHAFLVTSTTAIASPPTVAAGGCGDDAIAAYALAGGDVQVTRLRGTTWSAPETVAGLGASTYASIASTTNK